MRFHTQSFFCGKGERPHCHIEIKGKYYPASITINQSRSKHSSEPSISIFLESIADLVAFKNDVIGSFNKVIRGRYIWGEERSDD